MIKPNFIKLTMSGFSEVVFSIERNIFSNGLLSKVISEFFAEFIKNDADGNPRKYFLLLKIQFSNGTLFTLHKGLVVSKSSEISYINYCNKSLSRKSNDYSEDLVISVNFNFFLIEKSREKYYIDKWQELSNIDKGPQQIRLLKFSNSSVAHKMPANRDYLNWGLIVNNSDELLIISSNNYLYKITGALAANSSIEVIRGDESLFTFSDSEYKESIFIRDLDGVKYYIRDDSILLKTKELKTKFLRKLKKSQNPIPKIITIDIETIVIGGIHKPFLFSMYDGNKTYSWFSQNAKPLFDFLLRRKYKGYQVYAHNLSRFDIIFLLNEMAGLRSSYIIEIIKKDDKYISIKISHKNKAITIILKDSYLLLPSSLANLSQQFNVDIQKGIEPVFTGDPKSEYFMKDLSHYNKEIEKIENLSEWKSKVTSYCEQDCIALHQVLIKFRELVFDKWHVNLDKFPTVPSLAFAIYRSSYMPDLQIPITKGKVFDFIRESFSGGSTEMYKPYGKNIYVYDVNSLYPSVMKNNLFPVGNITQFEGDITILENVYWIGDVQISTKKDLYQPYIQLHHDTGNGMRTVAPNGTWTMKLNSPEYNNALKDYNISIRNGYYFEAKDIFSRFVTDMYELRKKYDKTEPMNFIAKLIMNSLYGRFAMKPNLAINEFIDKSEVSIYAEKYLIENTLELNDNTYLISYYKKNKLKGPVESDIKNSIGIASAVTAYARILMSKFKNNPNINLYYSDTDSIFTDAPLDDIFVGPDIGQMKLEYILKEAVFLGPKIYSGISNEDKYICKVKGFKDSNLIPFDLMKSLLSRDSSLTLSHTKWFRHFESSEIVMREQVYELQKTSNKRKFVYKDDIAVDTQPFSINR